MRDMSSDVDTSGRSAAPPRARALRRRSAFAMPRRGHGPFSFCMTMGTFRPKNETRFTL